MHQQQFLSFGVSDNSVSVSPTQYICYIMVNKNATMYSVNIVLHCSRRLDVTSLSRMSHY